MYEALKENLQKIKERHERVSGGLTEESVAIEYAIAAINELQQAVDRYKSLCEAWQIVARHSQKCFDEVCDELEQERSNQRHGNHLQ